MNNSSTVFKNDVFQEQKSKFGLKDKIGYMFGDFGNDFFFAYIAMFLMVFFTDVVGVDPKAVGILFLAARLWDAFMDVTWGRFIDSRPTTKNGKFRPWIIKMAPALVIFGALCFYKPSFLSGTALIIFSFSMYIIWGSLYSTVNIPYGSLASVISQDPSQRAQLSTWRSVGAGIAWLIVGTAVPIVAFVGDAVNPKMFFVLALIFAVFAFGCYFICYKMTTERVDLNAGYAEGERPKLNWGQTIKGLSKNKPLLILLLISFTLIFSNLFTTSINTYLFKDYYKDTAALGLFNLVSQFSAFLCVPFVTPLIKKFGKKEISGWLLAVSGLLWAAIAIFPIKSGITYVWVSTIATLGVNFFNLLIWAFVTDVIDYQELTSGVREDGTVYSIYSFSRKVGQAVAGLYGGVALGVVGYVKGAAGGQSQETASKIYSLVNGTNAVTYLFIAVILIFMYPLTKAKLNNLAADLAAKRGQRA